MMRGVKGAVAAAMMGAAMIAGGSAHAGETWMPENFSASLTFTSDYVFRGISQTLEDPAGQFTGEWTPGGTPIYVGAFVSNIDFRNVNGGRNATVELDLMAGVRGEWSILKWDVGAIYYLYPGQHRNNAVFTTDLNYAEFAVKTTWDVLGLFNVVANVFVSPEFQADSGLGVFVEGGVDYTLPWEIALSGRVGRQSIRTNVNFGVPDYNTWSLGISKEFFGRFVVGAAYYDTDISRANCAGGLTICDARGVGYVTFKF